MSPDPSVASPYQLLPALTAEQFAALKADVAERGVLVAVELDETGAVLDGHHRLRAWQELRAEGVRVPPYPRVVRRLPDEAAKLEHALRLNLQRRHLDRDQRAELAAELRRRGMSLRRIGAELDVGVATVWRDVSSVPNGTPERVDGLDGKSYRPARPASSPSVVVHSERDERRAIAALDTLGDDAPPRVLELRRIERVARDAVLERRRVAGVPDVVDGPAWQVRHCPIGDLELVPGSVDLVCTDPPYVDEAIPVFSELGAFAARTLKPGRLLVTYTGHMRLPEVLERLSEHLCYVWSAAVLMPGRHVDIRAMRIRTAHRAVLLFSAGPYVPRRWLEDTIRSPHAPAKDLHPWQQALGPVAKLVELCSAPGELVCDPFLGSGTTAIAAVSSGRRFVGCDRDAGAVAAALERLEHLGENGREADDPADEPAS